VSGIVRVMDELEIEQCCNLCTGAEQSDRAFQVAAQAPGRFVVFAGVTYEGLDAPDYPDRIRALLGDAKERGAGGVKVNKRLGLRARDAQGELVPVDDPRVACFWETAAELGLPVLIHTADPPEFWLPPDESNPRHFALSQRPEWAYFGKGGFSWEELTAQRYRMIEAHPRTAFIVAHLGEHCHELHVAASWLDRLPNLSYDIAARVWRLGKEDPRRVREFMVAYADRLLFGTDISARDTRPTPDPTREVRSAWDLCFRYLETEDRDFAGPTDWCPWTISGVGLPEDALRRIYYDNAVRLLQGSAA
jgi:predicted TIM-barrel fold metal-dependent hydrolase